MSARRRLPVASQIAFGLAGLGLVTAVLVATGVLTGADDPEHSGPPRPDAAPVAAVLEPFDDCAALRDWYVAHSIRDVTAYGWDGPQMYMADGVVRTPGALGSIDTAKTDQASSATGTNTQEADVDEPDVAKTDGSVVFRVLGGMLIVTDVGNGTPHDLARHRLPRGMEGAEILLVGDHVLAIATDYRAVPLGGPVLDERMPQPVRQSSQTTRVVDLDVSAPGAPQLVADRSWPGALVSARQYGDVVRLVTSLDRPALPFVQPGHGVSRSEARAHNRELVQQTTIGDWLPDVKDELLGNSSPAVDCGSVYHAPKSNGGGTVLVTGFRPGTAGTSDASSTAVTGDGQTVYSSADRLYVASPQWQQHGLGGPIRFVAATRTEIHAFTLDGTGATYVGSGEVAGTVRDRWSMDEQDGDLRVAVSRYDHNGRTQDNGIVVLATGGGRLVQIGQVWGLGRREDIQSVRWFDDLAVLVTFRQIDPLYTVDLSDPSAPQVLGALKVPGYSSYLHPIGDDRLLGLGTDATGMGEGRGAQAAVFDIRDLTDPRRLDTVGFGRWSQADAAWEPRELTWLPDADAAVTAVQDYPPDGRGRTVVHLLRVGTDGSLTDHTLGTVDNGQFRALPLADGRVALVDTRVRIVDVAQ